MFGCCGTDQSHNECVMVNNDGQNCEKLLKCCVGIHDAGLQRQCLDKVRECRKLGNAWDPIGPLKPLDAVFHYPVAPSYSTQGELALENFGSFDGLNVECITKGFMCGLLVALLIKYLFKTNLDFSRIIGVSLLGAFIQCMLKALR